MYLQFIGGEQIGVFQDLPSQVYMSDGNTSGDTHTVPSTIASQMMAELFVFGQTLTGRKWSGITAIKNAISIEELP